MNDAGLHGMAHDEVGVTPDELERERLRTYRDWAEVPIPAWWLPAYALLITGWIASFDLGTGWGTAAGVIVVASMALMVRAVAARSGVSTPRFRGMPRSLRRTFLIPGAAVLFLVAAAVAVRASPVEVPAALFGLVAGPLLAASIAWQTHRYRVEARRLEATRGAAGTELNPLIHAPKRLRLMAILSAFDHVTFARLQDRLELSAPDLSKQLKALQEPGYVTISKTGRGPGSQTWVSMTRRGMKAYNTHVAAG